jgi:hypothetical protein
MTAVTSSQSGLEAYDRVTLQLLKILTVALSKQAKSMTAKPYAKESCISLMC